MLAGMIFKCGANMFCQEWQKIHMSFISRSEVDMRGGEMASPYFHYHDSFGRFLESRVRLSCLKRVPKAPQSTMSHADLLFNHYRCTSPPSINSAGRARRHSNSYKLSKQQLRIPSLLVHSFASSVNHHV